MGDTSDLVTTILPFNSQGNLSCIAYVCMHASVTRGARDMEEENGRIDHTFPYSAMTVLPSNSQGDLQCTCIYA